MPDEAKCHFLGKIIDARHTTAPFHLMLEPIFFFHNPLCFRSLDADWKKDDMNEWTENHTLWEETRRNHINPAVNTGSEIDLSELTDEQVYALCDESLYQDMNFIADMSDSEGRREAERERNEILFDAVQEEAAARGWQ